MMHELLCLLNFSGRVGGQIRKVRWCNAGTNKMSMDIHRLVSQDAGKSFVGFMQC